MIRAFWRSHSRSFTSLRLIFISTPFLAMGSRIIPHPAADGEALGGAAGVPPRPPRGRAPSLFETPSGLPIYSLFAKREPLEVSRDVPRLSSLRADR